MARVFKLLGKGGWHCRCYLPLIQLGRLKLFQALKCGSLSQQQSLSKGGAGTLFNNYGGSLVEATTKGLVLKPPPKAAEPSAVRRPSGVHEPLQDVKQTSHESKEAHKETKAEELPPDDDFGDFQAAD